MLQLVSHLLAVDPRGTDAAVQQFSRVADRMKHAGERVNSGRYDEIAIADLDLDLLKKTLCFLLWPEPPAPIADYRSSGPPFRGAIVDVAKTLAHGPKDLVIARDGKYSPAQRIDGAIWPAYAHTMIGLKRLDNLDGCIERVLADGVEGDVIETGV